MAVDIKVRGYHLDIYQHVNNARYLEFLEEARWEFVEQHNLLELFASQNLAFIVVNINISYLRPALAGETLRVLSAIDTLGNKSGAVKQKVVLLKDGKEADTIAEAKVTFCLVDLKTQQTVPISGNVRASLENMIEEEL
ncbi:acyl-CoA thioesterase [Oceanobacter kriegii]|uniref:acyl-CoA thioesterase n=1 Tax=Oceanobacter kriegii TaxID=64972 RepID=UPI0004054B63|nr:thioesterase family protein [Oceanobacter kriegii]